MHISLFPPKQAQRVGCAISLTYKNSTASRAECLKREIGKPNINIDHAVAMLVAIIPPGATTAGIFSITLHTTVSSPRQLGCSTEQWGAGSVCTPLSWALILPQT